MIYIITIYVVFLPNIACANEVNSVQALQIMIKTNLKIKANDTHKFIEYCPDQTCEIIQAPISTWYQSIGDFSYLYLYYFSPYDALKKTSDESEPFRKAGTKYIKDITKRNRGECEEKDDKDLASCILRTMSSKNNIQIYSSRHEKGIENLTPLNLREILKTNSSEQITPEKPKRTLTEP